MTRPPEQLPPRILIVDDEPLNVDYLEQELESLGFATDTAADGLEALERVAAAPPDLVLLDVMMPGMDGISALRILKRDPETRLIPVVLMTALNAQEDRVRGIEAGADDFLSKPVDERELLARIRTALSLKRAIDEAMDALASTSAHLERYGRRERDVAVLVVEWRPRDGRLAEEAVRFVGRRHRDAAEARIRALGGTTSESEAGPLVAVFEGPDEPSRALAAAEAALAIVAEAADPDLMASAAIAAGPAQVGSTRVERAGDFRWLYGADGEPVERASALARAAVGAGVLTSGAVAAAVSDRLRLEPLGDGTYRVLGLSAPPRSDRRVTTILVTDIVGSTAIMERLGDRLWSELIAAYELATRSELARFGGAEVNTTGDGFLASFDAPAQAIRCALALIARVDSLGLKLRAGVHSGEAEHVGGRVQGIVLNLATRVAARARSGEVLVSATTRELAAGSGLAFSDRGEHLLAGVSERRRLYAAVEPRLPARMPAPAAADPPAGLSARELDVLRLVAAGLADAEVAEELFLSVRTVHAHLRSVYRKLGVRSRAAAGRFAAENGLL